MNLPSIRQISPNFTEVEVGGIKVYFSYKTPVAFSVLGYATVVHENSWGVTTGKHLNQIDGGSKEAKAKRIDSATFMKLWETQTDVL